MRGPTNVAPIGGVDPPPIHTGSVRNPPGVWRASLTINARCIARIASASTVSDMATAACIAAVLTTTTAAFRFAFPPGNSASPIWRAEA